MNGVIVSVAMMLTLAGCANATPPGTHTAYIYSPSVAGRRPALVSVELPDQNNQVIKRPITASKPPPAQFLPELPVPIVENISGPRSVCKNGIKITLRAGETAIVTNDEIMVRIEGAQFIVEGHTYAQNDRTRENMPLDGQQFSRILLTTTADKIKTYQYSMDTPGGPFRQWVVRSDTFSGTDADFPELRRIERAPNLWSDKPC